MNLLLWRALIWNWKHHHLLSELSSGIYCRVKWLSTDVSEVHTASIIRDEWAFRARLTHPWWWRQYAPLKRRSTIARLTHPWWWRQYAPLKCRSTIILHGSTSQKTILNIILAAVRTWNLTPPPSIGFTYEYMGNTSFLSCKDQALWPVLIQNYFLRLWITLTFGRTLGQGISLMQGLYLHRTRTNIHAVSSIWTHDLSRFMG
jgi:hypothetical protein